MQQAGYRLNPLIDRHVIAARVREIAGEIARAYAEEDFVVLCVYNGAFMFFADLVRSLSDLDLCFGSRFIGLSSYGEAMTSSGRVRVTMPLSGSVEGKRVLVVEDVVDVGFSMEFLIKHLMEQGAKTVEIVALLSKPTRRVAEIEVAFIGFEVGDCYVVGYGMDGLDGGRLREKPDIYELVTTRDE